MRYSAHLILLYLFQVSTHGENSICCIHTFSHELAHPQGYKKVFRDMQASAVLLFVSLSPSFSGISNLTLCMWVLLSLFQAGVSSLMSQLSRKAPGIETNTHPGCAGKRWILTSLMAQLLLLTWLSLLSWKDPPSWANPSSHFHSLLFFTSAELKD